MNNILEQLIIDRRGVLRRSEVLAAGLSRRDLRAQIKAGVWATAGRSVLIHHTAPRGLQTDTLVAAARYPEAILTGPSGALLRPNPVWTGRGFGDAKAMIIAPPHCIGAVQHPGAGFSVIGGLKVADEHTILVDLLRFLPWSEAAAIAGAANQQGLTTHARLDASVEELSGYPGSPQLVRLVRAMKDGAESGPEIDLHIAAYAAGLRTWVANPTITIEGEQFRPDIAFMREKVALEYDGLEEHSSVAAFHSDRQRDIKFQFRAGWMVARITSEVLYDGAALSQFMLELRAELRSRGQQAS